MYTKIALLKNKATINKKARCTPEPTIKKDGTVTAYIGCGGAFYSYNSEKMVYKGKAFKTCKIYGGYYLSGYYPIYFDAWYQILNMMQENKCLNRIKNFCTVESSFSIQFKPNLAVNLSKGV